MASKPRLLGFLLVFTGAVPALHSGVITLEEAYDRALETDQSVAIAHAEASKVALEAKLALTRLTPRLDSGVNATHRRQFYNSDSNSTSESSSGGANFGSAGLTLSQPILDFTIRPAVQVGRISERASMIDFQSVLRDTLLAVATAYYDVLSQQNLVAILRESLRLAQEQETLATARRNVGEVLETDVLKSAVVVQRAKRGLVSAENILTMRRSILANILNLGIEAKFSVAEPPSFPFKDETLTSTVQRAYRQREDLQSAALEIGKKIASRKEINAQYLPTLNAETGLTWDGNQTRSRDTSEQNWQAGLRLSIPWFSGGERSLKLQRSDFEIFQSKQELERIKKAVAENVEEAWLEVRALQQNVAGLKVEVAAAEENYRLLQNQYRAGEVKNLDVVQGLNDLNTSRTDLTVQSYQYQLALRDLARRTADFESTRVKDAFQRHFSKSSSAKSVVP